MLSVDCGALLQDQLDAVVEKSPDDIPTHWFGFTVAVTAVRLGLTSLPDTAST
jgi:urea transporter